MAPPVLHPLPILRAGALTLRPATPADAPILLRPLAEPAVAEWWGSHDLVSVTAELQGHFAIEIHGVTAGLLECSQEVDPTYPHVAMDIFLGSALHGRGFGRSALRLAIDNFVTLGHHRFTIDPATTNTAALHCYAAVGFRPVGVLREAERAPSGKWRDALLMDLLARELTTP